MKIVIDIPEEEYNYVKTQVKFGITNPLKMRIANGTPLPKGHGDLIDVNRKITVPIYDEQYEEWGEKILTVREALNRWSDEGITVKDVIISADKAESKLDGDPIDIDKAMEHYEGTLETLKGIDLEDNA